MRPNTVKRELLVDRATVGSWLSIGSAYSAEFMAHSGFDWLVVDLEHGPFGLDVALGMIQAIGTTDTVPMVRVAANDPTLIKQALDLGAYGLVVPMVNSRDAALAAVKAAKFPNVGQRSIGASRPSLYAGPDYLTHANDELLTILQIEHADGVANAEGILSVPGVDACFIGPSDLAASMGAKPSMDITSASVESAVQEVLQVGRRLNVAVGIHVSSSAVATRRIEEGFRFVAVSSDVGFMVDGSRTACATVEKALNSTSGA